MLQTRSCECCCLADCLRVASGPNCDGLILWQVGFGGSRIILEQNNFNEPEPRPFPMTVRGDGRGGYPSRLVVEVRGRHTPLVETGICPPQGCPASNINRGRTPCSTG